MIALQQLAPDVPEMPQLQVASLAIDSRQVERGGLFVALAGARSDGHDFIDAAAAKGAVAVFAERQVAGASLPVVVIDNLAGRVSDIAGRFFGHPSRDMQCVAVTGTNGKTSVAHFVAELAAEIGVDAGFLGTTGWGLVGRGDALEPAALTTADAIALQQRLAELRREGCALVALEVSSHALQQHRADALLIDVALFTNLTQDHLDYHGDMEAYGAAKARLFDFAAVKALVINACDEFGARLVEHHAKDDDSGKALLTLVDDAHRSRSLGGQQIELRDLSSSAAGMSWLLNSSWGCVTITTPIIGSYNALNLSLAIAALAFLGHDIEKLAAAVPLVSAPAGRLERVAPVQDVADQDDAARPLPAVFVDYAHTPDALISVLGAVRAHCAGRLLCVFGCGGDRDKGKRVPMGQAVNRLADIGFLTSDNPRFEDPLAIIADVEAGLPDGHKLRIEADRSLAIAAALNEARPDDLVLIAGKGHEDYQDIEGVRRPFDDVAVARALLERAGDAGGVA